MRASKIMVWLPLVALLAPACERERDRAEQKVRQAAEEVERVGDSEQAPVRSPEVAPTGEETAERAPVRGRDELLVQTDRGPMPLDDRGLIEQVETKLKSHGFAVGSVDGKVDAELVAAVEEFQRKNGLTANGRIDRATAEALELDWAQLAEEAEREEEPGLEEDAFEEAGEEILEEGEEAGERAKEKLEKAREEIEEKTE